MVVLTSLQDPKLIELLQKGAVGVIPTDTIYGLCTSATSQEGADRLYNLKQHEQKPGTVIAANIEQLIGLGVDEPSVRAVAHLWPNPLSIILPAPDKLAYLHQGADTLTVRIPADAELRKILEVTGPLLTHSASHPGQPIANNLEDAERYFAGDIDFYVEGGDRSGRLPSTVARLDNGSLEVTRQGAFALPPTLDTPDKV